MKTLPNESLECLNQRCATASLTKYCQKNGFTIVTGYEKAQPMHLRVRMDQSCIRSSLNAYVVLADKNEKRYFIVSDMYEGLIGQFDFSEFDETINRELTPEEKDERKYRNEYGPLFTEFLIAGVMVVRQYDADGWMFHAPKPLKKKK